MTASKKSIRSKSNSKTVRVAVVGTGGMGNGHMQLFKAVPDTEVVAVCDIDAARVSAFAKKHGIPESSAYTDFAKLLKECPVDAVAISTPDASHAPLSIQALRAGKHVLCEKPLGVSYAETKRMVAAARKAGTVAMVNFSYRNWPAIQAIASRVRNGEIGELRHIEASYLQTWLTAPIWGEWSKSSTWLWRLSKKHGSTGVLGDVGVHIIDFATFPAGPVKSVFAKLKNFPKAPGNRIGDYVLDANDSAVLQVEFENGALGVIHTTRYATGHANRLALKLHGTKGAFAFDSDVAKSDAGEGTVYRSCVGSNARTATWKDEQAPATPNNHERFIAAIRGTAKSVARAQPDFARGSEIQKVLDACFCSDAIGKPVRV